MECPGNWQGFEAFDVEFVTVLLDEVNGLRMAGDNLSQTQIEIHRNFQAMPFDLAHHHQQQSVTLQSE